MSTVTLENIPNICRTCLKNLLKNDEQSLFDEVEAKQPEFYHIGRMKDLTKWMAIINPLEDVTHYNRQHYDKYPKYVCCSCYENFKKVNDFKDMVTHSFDVLTKLLSVDNTDDVKHHSQVLPGSVVTPIDNGIIEKLVKKAEADNTEDVKQQQQPQLQHSVTQGELIIKSEPIGDCEDEEFIEEANCDEQKFMANDWKMDDATDVSNDSNAVLLANNLNLEPTEFVTPLAETLSSSTPPLNGEEGQPKATKAYKCPICNISYIHRYSYEAHIRQMHLGISHAFECDMCHKTYTKFSNLYRHMRKEHNQSLRQYKCEYNNCNRSFRQLTTRSKHYEEFHNLEPLPDNVEKNSDENTMVTCDICEKVLKLIHLKQHKLTVHEGIKPFACEYCKATFAAKNTLKLHTRIHTGEKPFTCSTCERPFAQLSAMKKHMKTHTGEKPYKCSICDIHFTQLSAMKKHMTTQTHRNAIEPI